MATRPPDTSPAVPSPSASDRLLFLIWGMIALFAALLCYATYAEWVALEVRHSALARSFARLVEEHFGATIDRTNITLLSAGDILQDEDFALSTNLPASRRSEIEGRLVSVQRRTSGIVSMSITNADGIVFANSVGTPPGSSLADRRYFLTLKAAPSPQPVVSEAIFGRVSGKWGIQIARRFEFPDGSFAGMIVANLGLNENFERFYESIQLGKDSRIVLLDSEKRMIGRFPIVTEALGKPVNDSAFAAAIDQGVKEAVLNQRSPIDGVTRLTALRKVPDYPVYVLVGLSHHQIYSSWRGELVITGMVLFALLIAGALITREIRRRQGVEVALLAAMRRAEDSVRDKSKFLAAASHDLRQPLQALSLFSAALQRTPLEKSQQSIAASIAQAAHFLGEILNTLLDISRLDSGIITAQRQAVDLHGLLEGLDAQFSPIFSARGLRFKLAFPQHPVFADSDPQLLTSLLQNLLDNAAKYTLRGGVLLAVRRRGGKVLLQVWDTGIGISPEDLSKIWNEYFQVGNTERDRNKGLGLGLSIVRRQAKLLGAEISCHSRLGRGTVFTVLLPAAAPPSLEITAPRVTGASGSDGTLEGLRVVLIEDDQMVSASIVTALGLQGISVRTFPDAASVLADPHLAEADFYLSDFGLPGGANGIDVLQLIEATLQPPVRAALRTGETLPEHRARLKAARWPVLTKPVELAQLLELLALRTK